MKSIQTIALLLWMLIFVVAAFILGQFLVSKDIFDITQIITGQTNSEDKDNTQIDDQLESEETINKVGQETVRVGLNIANEYFSEYYREYINYIMSNSNNYLNGEKISIDEELASDYVFYAISKNIDNDKYESELSSQKIIVTEADVNWFVDKMFEKEISDTLRNDNKNGYDKTTRKYAIEKNNEHPEVVQELSKIENVTSNQLILTYTCKNKDEQNIIKLTVIYKGGRYIVTEVLKEN